MNNVIDSTPASLDPVSQHIWDLKYRLKDIAGQPVDRTISDTWSRIAATLARAEDDPAHWARVFEAALTDYKFLPAGRIISGAGADRDVTLFNCFVMGAVPDDMAGIFDAIRDAALTMQQGGGIGMDFSTLRPKGAVVKGVGADASGPLSFMDVWDSMCRTIMSAGSRRGAMMATLRCDHPDIEAFIDAKQEPGRLRMFNLSVLVTDDFMTAVDNDDAWDLTFDGVVFNTIPARALWAKIMQATYAYAEPGVIFIDRINARNNLHYCEDINATNPCVTGDTRVMTEDGEMAISAIDRPIRVVGAAGALHPIEKPFVTGVKAVYRLRLEDGRELRCTADHRVLTTRGDVAAGELTPADHIVVVVDGRMAHQATGTDGAGVASTAFTSSRFASFTPDGTERVWDLTEPSTHHFVAGGIVVHNCGEQPLPPYGACLLGSINLTRLISKPFEEDARLDVAELETLVATAVRMMDNAITVSRFPLEEQAHEAAAKRRIGLGVTGLADALIMVGERYGSTSSVTLVETWMKALQRAAYLASIDLAKEKGAFPLFDRDAYLQGESVAELDDDVRDAIAADGIRNGLLTSIAPTGTISLFAGNVSSGCEPVFMFDYERNVLNPDGSRDTHTVQDYAYRLYRRLKGENASLTPAFVDTTSIAPDDHLAIQAVMQRYIDSSISKTINVPEDISFDEFRGVYRKAYELGCKGCTTYRPNDVTGAVLQGKADAKPDEPELPLEASAPPGAESMAAAVVHMTQPLSRPQSLPGATYKLLWADSEHAIYVTLNDIVADNRRRPFEVFINSKNMDHFAWTVALTRMISAVFRRGGDVSFVVEELKAVFDPRGGQWLAGKYVPSLLAAIGAIIEQHMQAIGFLPSDNDLVDGTDEPLPIAVGAESTPVALAMRQCPKCAQPAVIRQEGCETCTNCSYSKC